MAIDFWWIGLHETPTTAIKLAARCDSNGALTAVVNGTTYTGTTINTSTNDGVGVVDITGLTPDTQYSISLNQDGDSKTATVSTAPSDTDGVWDFCVGSCMFHNSTRNPGTMAMVDWKPVFIANLGDFIYMNSDVQPAWGESPANYNTNLTTATTTENYYAQWRQGYRHPASDYMRDVPSFIMPDDHEFPSDDWDHSIANISDPGFNNPCSFVTLQSEVDAIWNSANQASISYTLGNPDHIDSETPDAPPASGQAASNYPVRYFRFTVGPIDFICLDNISHRSSVRQTPDDATKTMLGANQKQWLKDILAASTATYAVIFCTKKTWNNEGDNTDAWFPSGANVGYTTERGEIESYIDAKSGWANTNLSVIWFTGDTHIANVIENTSTQHLCVNGCPLGADGVTPTAGKLNPNITYIGPTANTTVNGNFRCYTHVRVHGTDKLEIWIRQISGRPHWHGFLEAGDNTFSQNELSVTI